MDLKLNGCRAPDVDPGRLSVAQAVADVADSLGLSSSLVVLAWLRAQGGVIPILGARTAQQLAGNLACPDVTLPADALARLDRASYFARGFPHDFLAGADYTPRRDVRPAPHATGPGPLRMTSPADAAEAQDT